VAYVNKKDGYMI